MNEAPVQATPTFRDAEVNAFRTEDRRTAAAIFCTMVGIFTLALTGYTVICLWVLNG